MINRLSSRERVMMFAVLGIVFVFANLLVFSTFRKKHAQISADLEARQLELSAQKEILANRDLWMQRDAWISAKQPKMESRERAGVALLEDIKQAAKAHDVLLESPELGGVESEGLYQSVSVGVQTKSSWASLIAFLHALQQPEQFIVFESATLKIDNADKTQMRGQFRIAKWFAP
jgi:hypothetical protein